MYIPLPIELGIGLNLPVRLKLRKQLLNNINKRRNPNLRIDLILSRKIGPYQQNQQDHIGEVHHEDINDEETIAFGHGAMATVLDQTVDYFVEQQVDGQDYRGQGQHGQPALREVCEVLFAEGVVLQVQVFVAQLYARTEVVQRLDVFCVQGLEITWRLDGLAVVC